MELLRIENNEGYLCLNRKKAIVSQITAEDISASLELILTNTSVEIPEDVDCSTITNPAQKIIFEQLRSSFREVQASRDTINDEVNEAFAQAEKKYLDSEKA